MHSKVTYFNTGEPDEDEEELSPRKKESASPIKNESSNGTHELQASDIKPKSPASTSHKRSADTSEAAPKSKKGKREPPPALQNNDDDHIGSDLDDSDIDPQVDNDSDEVNLSLCLYDKVRPCGSFCIC